MQFTDSRKSYLPINRIYDQFYIDIEANMDRTPVQVTVENYFGKKVFHQVIKPHDKFFELIGQKDHVGLTDQKLIQAKFTWDEVESILLEMFRSRVLVSWNLNYEKKFFLDRLDSAFDTRCEMKRFANYYKEYNPQYDDYNWKGLDFAAEKLNISRFGIPHTSDSDTRLLREVSQRLDQILFHERMGMDNPTFNIKNIIDHSSQLEDETFH